MDLTIENYLADVGPEFEPLVQEIHSIMVDAGFGLKFQQAKNGVVVSYLDPQTKKTALNFVNRRKGPEVRIYADNIQSYEGILAAMPDAMKAAMKKAGPCKRLAGTAACNSRCPMGYEFVLDGEAMQKCRYNIKFPLTSESAPSIRQMLQKEIACRTA